MPFFLSFLLLINIVYANTITIKNKFKNLNRICIYNKNNSSLDIKLKINTYKKVCLTFLDASGVIKQECKYKEVSISPNNLRPNVIYYILDLYSANKNYKYTLTINADNDFMAGECPSDSIAKIANTSADTIAGAAALAGVFSGIIFFAGFAYALTPNNREEEE